MCGIVGYIGKRPVTAVLLEGLGKLEYRGYDSAGIAWLTETGLQRRRAPGKLSNLVELVAHEAEPSSLVNGLCTGIGHTRWATHGEPTEQNAHPHVDCTGRIVVVHNGIIENHRSLRQGLEAEGHVFQSETDTEVIAHLVEKYLKDDLKSAVERAVAELKGSYAMVVMAQDWPGRLVAVRKQSPLVLGIGANEVFLASDIPALLPYTRQVVFLEDDDLVVLSADKMEFYSLLTHQTVKRPVQTITWDISMAEKAGYRHFMLKEIFEQPQAILNTLAGRIAPDTGEVVLSELNLSATDLKSIQNILFLACGTSWHAGLTATYWFEEWIGIPARVELASEFRYRAMPVNEKTLVIPISQSGETADTLAGLRKAREAGARMIAICNVLGSTISREAGNTIYTHAGPEIGVASTKAFTSQLAVLYLMGLYLAQKRQTMTAQAICRRINAILEVPRLINAWLKPWQETASILAEDMAQHQHALYLGRHMNYPIALEGALKLKEISYIHAEGYAAGEMKHGPIALIDKDMPVVAIIPRDHVMEKMLSNVQEVKSRRGRMVILGEEDAGLRAMAQQFIEIPRGMEPDVNPFICVVPLQLLAYETAVFKGCDVDQPRNLAKSVTVE
ncbi:MAG: glutamine--fructose-6-phosphate transaminase (isomerizing) [Deltaproteobacteria bacterium]|nr:glutamine--fructose-6-phosphate transaminase (isomerizing) [Deltaproteobacteria bacterium]